LQHKDETLTKRHEILLNEVHIFTREASFTQLKRNEQYLNDKNSMRSILINRIGPCWKAIIL